MVIKTKTTDRTSLINFLKQETSESAKYMGAPTFQYKIGPFTVLRNADIETDEESGVTMLTKLQKKGYIDADEEDGIKVPFTTANVKARVNLLNMIAARGNLINKAIGKPVMHVNRSFLKKMQKANPADLNEFRQALIDCDAETELKGVRFYDDKVIFTDFPDTPPKTETRAFENLLTAMVRNAEAQRWVKPESVKYGNEKYFFRVWLTSLGLKGSAYASTRNLLLQNLNGDGAYRTEEQKIAAKAKRDASRKKKEMNAHAEFTLL